MAGGCLWIEDVAGTGPPTSLWPKMGLARCVSVNHPPAVMPWASQMERWQATFLKRKKTGNCTVLGEAGREMRKRFGFCVWEGIFLG